MGTPEPTVMPEQRFFEAWRQAVSIAGVRFFGDGTQKGFESAQGKNALCPRVSDIEGALEGMSPGEQIFICSMYQFYNPSTGRKLAQSVDLKCDLGDLTRLDAERRAVMAALIISYVGW